MLIQSNYMQIKLTKSRRYNLLKTIIITVGFLDTKISYAQISPTQNPLNNYKPVVEFSAKGGKRQLGEINYMHPIWQNKDNMFLLDTKLKADNKKSKEINVGLAYRHNFEENMILGVYGYFDHRRTGNGFSVSGATVGVETLSHYVDARANVYLPFKDKKKISHNDKKIIKMEGTSIYLLTGGHKYEYALKGIDAEIGAPIFSFSDELNEQIGTKVFVGAYNFRAKNVKPIKGMRFRIEQPLGSLPMGDQSLSFKLNAETQFDKVRKRQSFIGLNVRLDFDGRKKSPNRLSDRMMDTIIRDVDIVTEVQQNDPLRSNFMINGKKITNIYYVGAAQPGYQGDGTAEKPFSLEQIKKMNINEALIIPSVIPTSQGGKPMSKAEYQNLQQIALIPSASGDTTLIGQGEDSEVRLVIKNNAKGITIETSDKDHTKIESNTVTLSGNDNILLPASQTLVMTPVVKNVNEEILTLSEQQSGVIAHTQSNELANGELASPPAGENNKPRNVAPFDRVYNPNTQAARPVNPVAQQNNNNNAVVNQANGEQPQANNAGYQGGAAAVVVVNNPNQNAPQPVNAVANVVVAANVAELPPPPNQQEIVAQALQVAAEAGRILPELEQQAEALNQNLAVMEPRLRVVEDEVAAAQDLLNAAEREAAAAAAVLNQQNEAARQAEEAANAAAEENRIANERVARLQEEALDPVIDMGGLFDEPNDIGNEINVDLGVAQQQLRDAEQRMRDEQAAAGAARVNRDALAVIAQQQQDAVENRRQRYNEDNNIFVARRQEVEQIAAEAARLNNIVQVNREALVPPPPMIPLPGLEIAQDAGVVNNIPVVAPAVNLNDQINLIINNRPANNALFRGPTVEDVELRVENRRQQIIAENAAQEPGRFRSFLENNNWVQDLEGNWEPANPFAPLAPSLAEMHADFKNQAVAAQHEWDNNEVLVNWAGQNMPRNADLIEIHNEYNRINNEALQHAQARDSEFRNWWQRTHQGQELPEIRNGRVVEEVAALVGDFFNQVENNQVENNIDNRFNLFREYVSFENQDKVARQTLDDDFRFQGFYNARGDINATRIEVFGDFIQAINQAEQFAIDNPRFRNWDLNYNEGGVANILHAVEDYRAELDNSVVTFNDLGGGFRHWANVNNITRNDDLIVARRTYEDLYQDAINFENNNRDFQNWAAANHPITPRTRVTSYTQYQQAVTAVIDDAPGFQDFIANVNPANNRIDNFNAYQRNLADANNAIADNFAPFVTYYANHQGNDNNKATLFVNYNAEVTHAVNEFNDPHSVFRTWCNIAGQHVVPNRAVELYNAYQLSLNIADNEPDPGFREWIVAHPHNNIITNHYNFSRAVTAARAEIAGNVVIEHWVGRHGSDNILSDLETYRGLLQLVRDVRANARVPGDESTMFEEWLVVNQTPYLVEDYATFQNALREANIADRGNNHFIQWRANNGNGQNVVLDYQQYQQNVVNIVEVDQNIIRAALAPIGLLNAPLDPQLQLAQINQDRTIARAGMDQIRNAIQNPNAAQQAEINYYNVFAGIIDQIANLRVDPLMNPNQRDVVKEENYRVVRNIVDRRVAALPVDATGRFDDTDLIRQVYADIDALPGLSFAQKRSYKDAADRMSGYLGPQNIQAPIGINHNRGGQAGVGYGHKYAADVTGAESLNRLNYLYGVLDSEQAYTFAQRFIENIIRREVIGIRPGENIMDLAYRAENIIAPLAYRTAAEDFVNVALPENRLAAAKQIISNEVNHGISSVNNYLATYRGLDDIFIGHRVEDEVRRPGVFIADGLTRNFLEEIYSHTDAQQTLALALRAAVDTKEIINNIKQTPFDNNNPLANAASPERILRRQVENITGVLRLIGEGQRAYNMNPDDLRNNRDGGVIDIGVGRRLNGVAEIKTLRDVVSCDHGIHRRIENAIVGNSHRQFNLLDASKEGFTNEFNNALRVNFEALPPADQRALVVWNALPTSDFGLRIVQNRVDFTTAPQVFREIARPVLDELTQRYRLLDPQPKRRLLKQSDFMDIFDQANYLPFLND